MTLDGRFSWYKTSDITPAKNLDVCGALYVITDGEELGLAQWTNDPFGDDPDEIIDDYHFQIYGKACAIPNYWMGPITVSIPLHTNQKFNNKVDHGQPPITEDELKDPDEGTTHYRLTKQLGLSEDLAEKVMTNSQNLSFEELLQLLGVFNSLPISFSGTMFKCIGIEMVNFLKGQRGR